MIEFRWSTALLVEDLERVARLPEYAIFPSPKPRHLINAAFAFGEGQVAHQHNQTHVGYDFISQDGLERVFIETDKAVYIKLAPYSQWDEFSQRALSLLRSALSALRVEELSRIGVRYVNRIDVPVPKSGKGALADYISVRVDSPLKGPALASEFVLRTVGAVKSKDTSCAILIATTQAPLEKHVGVVLDIDVFTETGVRWSDGALVERLDAMRWEKNRVFEACLTDKSRALFGGEV